MRSLSIRLPETLDQDLAELAAQRGVSKSVLIRDAISDLIARECSAERSPADSFLALAEDLAGCVDGSEDLSTNADHLDGYGR